jgi:hypothetical protein
VETDFIKQETDLANQAFLKMSGALLAISVVLLQAFIPLDKPDIAEFISLLALATAIPLLSLVILHVTFPDRKFYQKVRLLFAISSAITLVGTGAALFHVSWIACVVFIVSTIAAIILFGNN